ncbi:FYVE zinc finger protein [Xylaria bambusicola]|uniref:FYVE zinc finger protein n=1 Tax=Xylaria bambusicola TaxID=326684 RepID=UPI0020072C62|nr:FYVE zinc finger protein [Xylaria bambusicola]KAI0526509.1 FYVE zinc finger protein [Xylaria bambusicola]
MATDFIMPRLADAQPSHYFQPQLESHACAPAQLPGHAPRPVAQGYQSRQVSPLSSNNGSPTSPKPYQRQRLRPLYMPAVLRPNEHPYKGHGNKNESEPRTQGQEDDPPLSSANSFITLPGLGGWSRLGRRTTGDSERCTESEWDLDLFPKPTAPPTRLHWKPDPEAKICDEPSCLRQFNYWTRRHHCRRCGNIFCDLHSAFEIPLDQDANYNPRGIVSRACRHCYTEFRAWRSRTNSQASSDDSSVKQISHTAPTSPVIKTPVRANPQAPPHPAEVAMSVPRDWHWSTF